MRKSAPFRVGAIISSPIPIITTGHSLFPQSLSRRDFNDSCESPCRTTNALADRHPVGVSTFRTSNRVGRVLPFRRRLLVSVYRPSSVTTSLVPFWAGPTQSRRPASVVFGPFSLTTFDGSSLVLTLQPSLAPHRDTTSRITLTPSRVQRTRLGGYIAERLAPDRYQSRTAPLATGG